MNSVFTICSENRIPFLLTMAESLWQFDKTIKIHVLMLDDFRCFATSEISNRNIVFYKATEIEPDYLTTKKYLTRSPLEIACGFKPTFARYLFSTFNFSNLIYCDTDLFFLRPIDDFNKKLNESNGLFTPHRVKPVISPDLNAIHGESVLMTTGIYNMGFFGLRKTDEVMNFLAWWKNRLDLVCTRNAHLGLFDDQLWINAAVTLFKDFKTFNDPGYNVAVWNLSERTLTVRNNEYFANERPLTFFHFSGANLNQSRILASYSHYKIDQSSVLKGLYEKYRAKVLEHGFKKLEGMTLSKSFWI